MDLETTTKGATGFPRGRYGPRVSRDTDSFRVLTGEKRSAIIACVRKGNSLKVAASIAMVGYNTLMLALKDGERDLEDSEERGLTLTCGAEFYLKVSSAQG